MAMAAARSAPSDPRLSVSCATKSSTTVESALLLHTDTRTHDDSHTTTVRGSSGRKRRHVSYKGSEAHMCFREDFFIFVSADVTSPVDREFVGTPRYENVAPMFCEQ